MTLVVSNINSVLDGLSIEEGNVISVAGGSGSGKTRTLMQLTTFLIGKGYKVFYIDEELTLTNIYQNLTEEMKEQGIPANTETLTKLQYVDKQEKEYTLDTMKMFYGKERAEKTALVIDEIGKKDKEYFKEIVELAEKTGLVIVTTTQIGLGKEKTYKTPDNVTTIMCKKYV